MMEEAKANLWNGVQGSPSDYELACQLPGYASKLQVGNTEALILGDEPLQTSVAVSKNLVLIVRWKWADSDFDIYAEIEKIDFGLVVPLEFLRIDWSGNDFVVFDAADVFSPTNCIRFSTQLSRASVSTFIYGPTQRLSVLIHVLNNSMDSD